MKMYSVIDLFAGAGGLSLGFMQTQKYNIKVAFENSRDMQITYKKNHPNVDVRGDVCSADYKEIQAAYGRIDVVIGGPPCQGFSNANRQKSHAISQNNMLVKQYVRAILELKPKAFVMENVSMLRSEVHRFYLSKSDGNLLEQYQIPSKKTEILLIEKNYLFDSAHNIICNSGLIRQLLWNENHYALLNIVYKACKNLSKLNKTLEKHKKALLAIVNHYNDCPDEYINLKNQTAFSAIKGFYSNSVSLNQISERIVDAIMIQRMLSKAQEILDNNLVVDDYILDERGLSAQIRSFAVFDYIKAVLGSGAGYNIKADVLCAADYGAPQKRKRFVVLGINKNISSSVALPKGKFDEDEYHTVRDAIHDLEDIDPVYDISEDTGIALRTASNLSDLGKQLRDSALLKNHIVTKTTSTAMERFKSLKQGQNFHSLSNELKTNTYTDVSRTQNTIYLRLNYDEPCGTVVNVRKSMWIHPTKDRAISVREAARLQTFPDSFVFYGTKDKQYQQVGNAVPPIMAKAIAKKLAQILDKGFSAKEKQNG